jgi:hypothetical protein
LELISDFVKKSSKECRPTISDRLYTEAIENYSVTKNISAKQEAVPVFQNIRQTQGAHIENVVVPFTDGRKGINVLVPTWIKHSYRWRRIVQCHGTQYYTGHY